MKVLFYVRANHEEVKGGDLVQLYSTGDALKQVGVSVDYSSDDQLDLSGYDLVHIFNSPRFDENLNFLNNAKNQNKPVAFSTIFWSKGELIAGASGNQVAVLGRALLGRRTFSKLVDLAQTALGFIPSTKYGKERKLFVGADILLPNSEGEMRQISKTYRLKKPFRSVRNAIDLSLFSKEPSSAREDVVLSVARIEKRKNTHLVVEACHSLGTKLVLIGGYDKDDSYATDCLKKVGEYGFEYLGLKPREEIVDYYYRAKVHALAAWYETPGLSSMEAACGGCVIVSTDRGSTREYFNGLAIYCDPFSQKSVTSAIAEALKADNDFDLRKRIVENYTWDLAAQDTLEGYRQILKVTKQ